LTRKSRVYDLKSPALRLGAYCQMRPRELERYRLLLLIVAFRLVIAALFSVIRAGLPASRNLQSFQICNSPERVEQFPCALLLGEGSNSKMYSYDNKRTQVAPGKIVSSPAQLRPAAARHSVQAQLSNNGKCPVR